METGKSQETLDSVGLQSSSVKEADDLESRTGEGTSACWTFRSLLGLPCCLSGFGCLPSAPAQFSDHELVSNYCLMWINVTSMLVPASVPITGEDKWMVIVDRAGLLLIQATSGLYKVQEQFWRLLELHSIKIVSSGIIWVSLQEVGSGGTSVSLI